MRQKIFMAAHRLALVLLAFLVCGVGLRADGDEASDSNDIPVVGRPSDLPFSEASGWFEVWARAEPTVRQAETPLTFTVSVRAVRPTRQPPQRLDLRQLPAFDQRFHIEDPSEELNRPDEKTW